MIKICVFLFSLLTALLLPIMTDTASAEPVGQGKKILFIPLDNRPITDRQTSQAAEKLGFEMAVPPDELLGSKERPGDPDGLWAWLEENARGADAAVVSTDAMLYGSLVESRVHDLTREQIAERVEKFRRLHEMHPRLPVYAYGTILRTLLSPQHSGEGMEPEDYRKNAMKILAYSVMRDRLETGQIKEKKGKKELAKLTADIPAEALASWEERHRLNYDANRALMELAKGGELAFLYLGADDSAPLSQTHYEFRHLRDYGREIGLGNTEFQITSGADELAMVMLCRAVTASLGDMPFVYTAYNKGKGKDTIPSYCLEEIGKDIEGIIIAAGGVRVSSPERAEMVLAVNTSPNGKTFEANSPKNTTRPRNGTKPFVSMVKGLLDKGYTVAVGDIATANGSDNAMMDMLRKEGLLFRIRAYGGWNTATNTMGFLIGTGIMTKWMDPKDANELMLTRYLDEWAYQANVRQRLAGALSTLPGGLAPDGSLGGKQAAAAEQGTIWMREFAEQNIPLPEGLSLKNLAITHPWNRLFECDIFF